MLPETTSAATNPQAQTPPLNGSEELAMAESYLTGTAGKQRDSAEAAKWLWKAVAKHNPEAMELLSDLYLRGEGIPKNCEQARVLLDAAARRGVKDAADRLTHLQDFGCQ
jgi:TPR repeat protein